MAEYTKKDEFYSMLVEKAREDMDFRDHLKNRPKETIEEFLGVSLPQSLEIVVHEDSREVVHLVLPPQKGEELSETELQAVAGGVCYDNGGGGSGGGQYVL